MQKLISVFLLGMTCAAFAGSDAANPVRTCVLDHSKVVRIPVSTERLTTVAFPSEIAGLESVFMSLDPDPDSRFQLSFESGSRLFSLRALVKNTGANLNVIYRTNIYVVEFYESDSPALSVTFLEEGTVLPQASSAVQPPPPKLPVVTKNEPLAPTGPQPIAAATPSSLVNITGRRVQPDGATAPIPRLPATIETAKQFAVLRLQYPAAAALIQYETRGSWLDYGTHYLRLDEIFRFDKEDVIVFRATLRNKTARTLYFNPLGSGCWIERTAYFASEINSYPWMLPYSESTIYLKIKGAISASGWGLSPLNNFQVFIGEPSYNAPATDIVPLACPSSVRN